MKKINKKGFTLVELLAVLIILIIIVFIAISKVTESSQKAKDNTLITNVGVYIKAVNDFLDLNTLNTYEDLNATYPVSYLETLGVKLSGTKPSGGYVVITDDEVTKACLEYDEFYLDYRKGKVKSPKKGSCNLVIEYAFEYTGSYQEFVAPFPGSYKIELWGASGGNNTTSAGNGGYTSGTITLTEGDKLYIYVGGTGSFTRESVSEYKAGGYNGGGSTNGQACCGRTYGSGGGATDIRLKNGEWNDIASLASRIMVAGGGGGGFNGTGGGAGGGLTGQNAQTSNGYGPGPGATQTSGGINTVEAKPSGSFGVGGYYGNSGLSTGGGGGYYGGSGSHHIDAAGGGSSYISGHTGCVAIKSETDITPKNGCVDGTTDNSCSIHYSNYVFTNTVMKSGNEQLPSHDGKTTTYGNSGNGYARISASL